MALDPREKYTLNPVTLIYEDPATEADYQQHYPNAIFRSIRPMILMLVPFLFIVAFLELSGALDTLVRWEAAATLAAVLLGLYWMTGTIGRFVELGLITTFLAFEIVLLMHVETNEDFSLFLPGVMLVMLLTPFVGLKITHGWITTGLLLFLLVSYIKWKGLEMQILLDGLLFLIPGLIITLTTGHTIDRQRRRLYSQLQVLEHEREAQEKRALHDALTELPNRNLLRERMEQAVARSKRNHGQFAVLFIDLDDFKTVNDSYGHAIGDQVLKQIAKNLLEHVRGEDTVARIGGDEFVILSEHIDDTMGAKTAADRVQAAVSEPIVITLPQRADTIHIHVGCSIGISLCPKDGDTLESLVERADQAMYEAKKDGKHTSRFFDGDAPAGTESPA
jgi:diguanylate cyclase (GGDEF)-like protein